MKSEVHKSHQHHHQNRHHSRRHQKKQKHQQESLPRNPGGEISPVPVPSQSSGSESSFPLAKEQTATFHRQYRYNQAAKKGEISDDILGHQESIVLSSDSEIDDNEGLVAKRKRKHKHKDRKKRRHQNKKQAEETEIQMTVKVKQEPSDSDSDHRHVKEYRTVRLKQEPVDSDEENSRRQRSRRSPERHGDSNSNHRHLGESNGRQRTVPHVAVKEEPRDREQSRYGRQRRDSSRDRRDRRNGRDDDEARGRRSLSRERDHRPTQSRNRDRNRRSEERDKPAQRRGVKREGPSGDEGEYEWGRPDTRRPRDGGEAAASAANPADKQKPNFGLSGKLTEDTNTFNGIVIKYSEPPEARKPKRRWRFYPFKGDQGLPTLYLHRQSAYLIGRDRKVADIPVDHPSCSKQHAALQYRLVPFTREDGSRGKRVRPYIIDLDSANGTYVNNQRIDPRKYVELMERDVIKFGYSSRDYVLLHEQSKDEEEDDDNNG